MNDTPDTNDTKQPIVQATFSTQRGMSLAPQNLVEAMAFADMLSKSDMVPKDFIGKSGNILVAIQWGMELGLQPMQSMQNIAVINGRPSLWGDSVLAIVLASPVCEDVVEWFEGTPGTDEYTAFCLSKRKGKSDKLGKFSIANARKAGLWDKAGPWKNYPERMLQMRARGFSLRDQFTDVLKGMPITEELLDIEKDINPAPQNAYKVSEREPAKPALQHSPNEPIATQSRQAEAAPAQQVNQQQSNDQPSTDTVKPNHIRMIRSKLLAAEKDEAALCTYFKVGVAEELKISELNNVLDWISGKGNSQ